MSKKIIAFVMILVLAVVCLAACNDNKIPVPAPSSDVAVQETEEATTDNVHKADAEEMRDYLGQYLDLSLYSEGTGSSSYDYTIGLGLKSAIEHKLDTIIPEVVLPDFKNLRYGMQFKEMEDAGFVAISTYVDVDPQVGVPASLTVSKDPYITIDLMVYNPLTTTGTTAECIIDTIHIPVEDGLTFDYNGITEESTLEDIIEILGAPDQGIQINASEYEATHGKGDKLRYRMFYDNRDADHTQTEIDFVYDKETATAAFSRLAVYENDY